MTTGRINQVAITRRPIARPRVQPPSLGLGTSVATVFRQNRLQNTPHGVPAIFHTRPDIPLQERTPQDNQAN